jgi:hypothetical protein
MNAAVITPLPNGQARFSWRGIEETFGDVFEALVTAAAHQIPAEVVEIEPYPPTPMVLAVSPALKP